MTFGRGQRNGPEDVRVRKTNVQQATTSVLQDTASTQRTDMTVDERSSTTQDVMGMNAERVFNDGLLWRVRDGLRSRTKRGGGAGGRDGKPKKTQRTVSELCPQRYNKMYWESMGPYHVDHGRRLRLPVPFASVPALRQ